VSTRTPDDHLASLPVADLSPEPSRTGRGRRARRGALWVLGGLMAAASALFVVGYLAAGDKVPRNAAVAGVPVGGLSRSAARATLEGELGPRATAPLRLRAGDATAQLDPAAAGLTVDYEASIQAAGGGRSLDPRQIWRVLTGGRDVDAVVAADQEALATATAAAAAKLDGEPADAELTYRRGGYAVTEARGGVAVRQQEAAEAIAAGYLDGSPVELPADTTPAAVPTAEAERVRAGYADIAVSGPVQVKAGGAGSFDITPAMIGSALRFRVEGGRLVPSLDPARLRKVAGPAVDDVELTKPRDATVRLVGGRPKVVPAVDGTSVTAAALAEAVGPALTKTGSARRASVELSGAEAGFSTADAKRLGIQEVTGAFTTRFPYAEYRNINISRAAELIDGTLLRPGQTFSLNKVVGERTKANGFTEGFIISGGKFKRELGGGVSQSATTTFNAMFFAGLKDVEHQPHTLYIDRYPPGREATVAWPNLDLKFTNDTRYGVLVQASTVRATASRPGSITVRMWSTPTYDKVESTTARKSNFTSGRDLVDTSGDCEPQEPARGFDVDYARLFYSGGKVVKRESFSWRYGPTDRISCS